MLREALAYVVENFGPAQLSAYSKNPVADYIRGSASAAVRAELADESMVIASSAGSGQWADIPWITIMDPRVTDSPTRGYYLAYLFNWRAGRIYLSLNQGYTEIQKKYGRQHIQILGERASTLRNRLTSLPNMVATTPIQLDAKTALGRGYQPGHALGYTYELAALPADSVLVSDLRKMVALYKRVFILGGTDPAIAESDIDVITVERPQAKTVEEMRVYKAHRSIERRPSNATKVKRLHGRVCQGCLKSMQITYGEIGKTYIEAHHLIPLHTLAIGIPVEMNIRNDFCVLCPNCHRMIHLQDDPSDLAQLRRRIDAARIASLTTS